MSCGVTIGNPHDTLNDGKAIILGHIVTKTPQETGDIGWVVIWDCGGREGKGERGEGIDGQKREG